MSALSGLTPEPEPEQEVAIQQINDNWPIATYRMEPDGTVAFTCDDGDTGRIEPDGRWDWTT